jgi:hypothetical protein
VTTAPPGLVASAGGSTGTVTVGFVVSWTMTLKEREPLLPCESVALHVTGVVPRPKVLPDAGEQVGTMEPSTTSEADAAE